MTDQQYNSFYFDLLEAQKEIEAVDKDGKNPFFKSEYTSLNSTIDACKKILNKHNIILIQPIMSTEIGVQVCSTLIHISGERQTSNMIIREAKDHDPQAQGSAITYARRYSLKSLLCMSDADDDGNLAQTTYTSTSTHTQSPSTHKSTTTANVSHPTAPKSSSDVICQYHKVKMFKTPRMKDYAHRDEVKGWCNGAGYKDEKEAWNERKNDVMDIANEFEESL